MAKLLGCVVVAVRRDWQLYVLLAPALIAVFIFCYLCCGASRCVQ